MEKLIFAVVLFGMIVLMLGSIEPAFATTTTLDVANTGFACESLGGVWNAGTSTCTLSSLLLITASDTLTINSGVTLEFTMGANLANRGSVTNNGILTLTGDGTDKSGRILNLDSGMFTNTGTINLIGGTGDKSGSIVNLGSAIFTNTGTMNFFGAAGDNTGGLKIGVSASFTNSNIMVFTGGSGRQSGYIGVVQSGIFTNNGFVTLTGADGQASALLDNWDSGSITNTGTITITGNTGINSGRITNMGTGSFSNSGIISITGGIGTKSGQLINSGNANFENLSEITISASVPTSNSNLFNVDSSTFTNRGTIILPKNLVNSASLINFNVITIGKNLSNLGKTINNCGTITINGILVGNAIVESKCSGTSHSHEDPTIGKTSWGFQVVENGICIDIRCWTVTADFHQDFDLVEILSDSTHTISTTVFCQKGVAKCNYVAFGVSPYGTNINDSVWKIILQKDHKDNWTMTVIDPDGYLGDVTSTTQIVNDEKNLAASITVLFKKPTPGMILNVEIRDTYGGYRDFQFNDGIAIKDAYTYPVIDAAYEEPLEIKSLCLNENPNKRYTCAFDKVREWTIKNAEVALSQLR